MSVLKTSYTCCSVAQRRTCKDFRLVSETVGNVLKILPSELGRTVEPIPKIDSLILAMANDATNKLIVSLVRSDVMLKAVVQVFWLRVCLEFRVEILFVVFNKGMLDSNR